MSFRDLVASNPRGLKLSYAVLMTGDPNIYTDGKASWSSFDLDRTERAGCLITREWAFTHKSDPQNPLTTAGGSGPSIRLIDDGTGEVFRTFSTSYEGAWSFITEPLGPASTDTTLTVQDATVFTEGQFLHLGLEAVKVVSIDTATEMTVERAQLGTLRRRFAMTNQTGIRATSSPRTKRGRFVEVWAAPVDTIDKTLDLANKELLWVGIVEEVDLIDEIVEIETAPLDKLLQSSWPNVLPTGSMYTGEAVVSMTVTAYSVYLYWYSQDGFGSSESTVLSLGSYDESGVFSVLPVVSGRQVALPVLLKMYQDTLNNFMDTTSIEPFATGRPYRNAFSFWRERVGEKWYVRATCAPGSTATSVRTFSIGHYYTTIQDWAVAETLWGAIPIGTPSNVLRQFDVGTYSVSATDYEMEVTIDNPLYPFELSYENTDNIPQGFIKIESGGKWEIASFASVTIDPDDNRRATLGGLLRGLGGNGAQDWTSSAAGEVVKISQLLTISGNEYRNRTLSLDEVLGTLLVSTEDPFQQGVQYDRLSGKGQGLQIPLRYVDTARMRDVSSSSNLLEVGRFWVDEKGKGKESLAEYLKTLGVFMVTRRFERDGEWTYGLSVDIVDPPVSTSVFDTIDDGDRLANSKTRTKNNERLIINSIMSKPFLNEWGNKDSNSEPITVFDQWSIESYGASKPMELKPTILYKFVAINSTGISYYGREAQLAWMEFAGMRWFGAYARGHYTLDMECPAPVGWRFSMTDRVSVSLTGVRDPEGNANIASVPAKIVELEHLHGPRAGTRLSLRLGYEDFAEIAPCAKVVNIASNVLTIASNHFSDSDQIVPHTGRASAQDGEWFRANDVYEDDLAAVIWNDGDYANREEIVVSSRSGSTLTLKASLSTASIATNLAAGVDTYITFAPYSASAASPRQNLYAHIADNGSPPDVDGDRAKEFA